MPRLAAGFEGLDDDHTPAAARTSVPLAAFVKIFGAVAVRAGRRRVGYTEEPAGQCNVVRPVGVGEKAVVTDAVKSVGQLPLALLAARLVFRRAGRRTTSSADFEREGVWETISAELHMAVRERMEREASPSAAMLDSQSVKSPGEGPAETANITATANMWRAAGSPASCLPAGVC